MKICLNCGYKYSPMELKIASSCPICGKETRDHEKKREAEEALIPNTEIGTGRISRQAGEDTDHHVAHLAHEAVMMSPFIDFVSPQLIKKLSSLSIFSALLLYIGIVALMYFQFDVIYCSSAAAVLLVPFIFIIFMVRLMLESSITLFSVRDVLT